MGMVATEFGKQGNWWGVFVIACGIPLLHYLGPNSSKAVRNMIIAGLTLLVVFVLASILYVWADSLAQGAAVEGTWEGDAGSSQLIGSWVESDGSTTTYYADGTFSYLAPPTPDIEITSWRKQCEWPQCTDQMIIEQEQYTVTATVIEYNAIIGDVLFYEITSFEIDGIQQEITDGECGVGVRANRITSDSSWNNVVADTEWPSFCDSVI